MIYDCTSYPPQVLKKEKRIDGNFAVILSPNQFEILKEARANWQPEYAIYETDGTLRCPVCKRETDFGDAFCRRCGKALIFDTKENDVY